MGNSVSPPKMTQIVVKVEFYKKNPMTGIFGVLMETIKNSKQIAVVVTTENGHAYRIEYEPDTTTDKNYRELHRIAFYRIVLVPKGEMNRPWLNTWTHEETMKEITVSLTLNEVFEAVCKSEHSPEMSIGEISSHLMTQVKNTARQRWFENQTVRWIYFSVVVVIMMLIIILMLYPYPLFVLLLWLVWSCAKSVRPMFVGCLLVASVVISFYVIFKEYGQNVKTHTWEQPSVEEEYRIFVAFSKPTLGSNPPWKKNIGEEELTS